MTVEQKSQVASSPSFKKRIIDFYKLIRRPAKHPQPRTQAEMQRLNLLVWGLVAVSLIAFIASLALL